MQKGREIERGTRLKDCCRGEGFQCAANDNSALAKCEQIENVSVSGGARKWAGTWKDWSENEFRWNYYRLLIMIMKVDLSAKL
jgi:hypothetical protein